MFGARAATVQRNLRVFTCQSREATNGKPLPCRTVVVGASTHRHKEPAPRQWTWGMITTARHPLLLSRGDARADMRVRALLVQYFTGPPEVIRVRFNARATGRLTLPRLWAQKRVDLAGVGMPQPAQGSIGERVFGQFRLDRWRPREQVAGPIGKANRNWR